MTESLVLAGAGGALGLTIAYWALRGLTVVVAERIPRAEGIALDKLLGIIPTPGRSAAELFAAGYDLVLGGADNVLLREAAEADVANLKASRQS